MNINDYSMILFVVIIWPLLLALPTLHTRLPFARYLVLVPAVLLAFFPGETTVTPAWLLFGAGFEFDHNNRWLLVMAIVVWTAAATTYDKNTLVSDKTFPFFSLTLTGHLGTILSADIVSYFCCSTLMSYSFYALVVRKNDEASRWAGRFYITFIIIADLLLFEGILLAAYGTDELQYSLLYKAIINGNISIAFVWLVSIAFIIKAGMWPAHIWLATSFKSAARPAYILLTGVPVVMGLFGLIRWIPTGEIIISEGSIYFQVIGIVTILYALRYLINKGYQSMLPVSATLFMTGLFVTGLGTVMTRPELWNDYNYLAYPFLALLGIFSAALCFLHENQPQTDDTLSKRIFERVIRLKDILNNIQLSSAGKRLGIKTYTRIFNTQSNKDINPTQWVSFIDAIEHQIRCWPVIITFLVLFLLAVIFLASLTI
ncbi:MAG: proton-conducting transporter membrane subunit [Gammaproteobacteria bacterium]